DQLVWRLAVALPFGLADHLLEIRRGRIDKGFGPGHAHEDMTGWVLDDRTDEGITRFGCLRSARHPTHVGTLCEDIRDLAVADLGLLGAGVDRVASLAELEIGRAH